jgi:hypothetical protein
MKLHCQPSMQPQSFPSMHCILRSSHQDNQVICAPSSPVSLRCSLPNSHSLLCSRVFSLCNGTADSFAQPSLQPQPSKQPVKRPTSHPIPALETTQTPAKSPAKPSRPPTMQCNATQYPAKSSFTPKNPPTSQPSSQPSQNADNPTIQPIDRSSCQCGVHLDNHPSRQGSPQLSNHGLSLSPLLSTEQRTYSRSFLPCHASLLWSRAVELNFPT